MEKEDKLRIIDDLDHFLTELAMYKIGDLQKNLLRAKIDGVDATQAEQDKIVLCEKYSNIIVKLQSLRAEINGEDWQSSEESYVNDRWMESTC